jgi:hypothetical protein
LTASPVNTTESDIVPLAPNEPTPCPSASSPNAAPLDRGKPLRLGEDRSECDAAEESEAPPDGHEAWRQYLRLAGKREAAEAADKRRIERGGFARQGKATICGRQRRHRRAGGLGKRQTADCFEPE